MSTYLVRGRPDRILKIFARTPRNKYVIHRHRIQSSYPGTRCLSVCSVRSRTRGWSASSSHYTRLSSVYSPRSCSTDSKALEVSPDPDDLYKERFVPLTRRSLIRHLMTDDNFLTDEEKEKYEIFALALDSAIVNRYHGLLRELKTLFDPINPDKDTIRTRKVNKKEQLDNEFWLIQKLAGVMSCANFHELPKAFVERSLAEHDARHGVKVSVNTDKYDVLRFWALGKETPPIVVPISQRILNSVLRRPNPKPLDYFKRVVVAVRLKKDDKLLLKAFKEVPVNALEQLLPDGRIQMSRLDKGIITVAGSIALFGVLAKVVTLLAHIHVDWTLLITGVTAIVGVQGWTAYKNRHLRYVNELARMLYFKNVANNRGLLTLLVDRAEDELFKEALLMYTLLLTTRPPSAMIRGSSEHLPVELGAISGPILERKVESWVQAKTRADIHFDSSEAAHLLTELGLLSKDLEENYHVMALDAAIRNLPQTPQSITARADEYDIVEGYDRDPTDETEKEYRDEEKKRRFFGWF